MDSSLMALWVKIENFDIDGAKVEFPFVKRLAKENGWSPRFAERVVEEYRRFVFLAMAADHPVTPSKIVDEAWHLHLTYTISYWERLTKEILPRALHHHPTQGGRSEDAKHSDQYERTLESYRRFFGTAPPDDIWPRPGAVAKNRAAVWLKGVGASLGGAMLAAGCVPFLGQSDGGGTMLWWILGGAGVLILGGIFWAMQSMGGGSDPASTMMHGGDPTLDPRRDQNPGYGAGACSTAGSGHYIDHGGSSESSGSDHGGNDSGGGDSGGGDSGGSSCGSSCGGGGSCSS